MKHAAFFGCLSSFFFCSQAQVVSTELSKEGVETNEPCITIDPLYPATQFLGSNNNLLFVSQDGGFTWSPKTSEPPEGFFGDPVVKISRNGTFYLCHLAKNKSEKWPAQFDRIVFERSTDGGQTFSSTGVGYNPGKVQDKPWVFVDEGRKSAYRDRIYLSWTEFDAYGSKSALDSSRIRVAWSENGGVSFETPVVISDTAGDAADDDFTLEGATLAAGKQGALFAVWAGKNAIWFDKSLDGGKTWGKDRIIARQEGGWNQEIKGLYRANSMPFIAADLKGGLYVVWADARNGDLDVFYMHSADMGATWTAPIRVNSDAKGNGRDQYMPSIAVDGKTGIVYAMFYDRRNSENNLFTDVYACALKKEKVGPNIRLTNESFCVPSSKLFFGDYISIAAAKGAVRGAYTVWDNEKLIVTVRVAMLDEKVFKKQKNMAGSISLQVAQLVDSSQMLIHFNLPEARSCTLEMFRGNQLSYKQLFDPLMQSENEVLLDESKFASGVYKLVFSFKGRKIEQDIYIEKR